MKVKDLIQQLKTYDQNAEIKIRVDSKDKNTENFFDIDTVDMKRRMRTVEVDKVYPGCKIRVIGLTPYINATFSSKRNITR